MSTAEGTNGGISRSTKQMIALAVVMLLAVLGLVLRGRALGGRATGARSDQVTRRASIGGAAERAFLAPLTEGSSVEGAVVTRIGGIEDGLIRVDLRRGREALYFAIGLAHEGYDAPRAGRYAVYIWGSEPSGASSALAQALANSLRTHADRPPPPGMTSGNFNARH